MITFVHPEFLYLMFPGLIVLFYFLITGKEEHQRFFSDEVLARLQVSTNTLTMRARNALFFTMFALLIVALAQPVIEDGKVKVKAKSADIMIAVDISDSMLAQDLFPSRLEAAKQKVLDLLSEAPKERIGLMAFAKDAYLVSPLSFDHRAVRFLLKQVNTASITEKGTDYIGLINAASEALKSNENRYMLILSDGGDQEDFSEEIALAKEKGIKVFVLAMGTQQGAPIKLADGSFVKYEGKIIVSKLNEKIKQLAFETGGAYVESVTSAADIKAMLEEIASKTIRKELKEEEVMLYIALFYYPLGLALLLLLIATSSMSKRQSVQVPHLFVAFLAALHVNSAEAGILDFQTLDAANSAYEQGDYNTSSKLFGKYMKEHPSVQAHYNRANADYKSGRYDAAIKGYEQVHTNDTALQSSAFHNMGNAYAKKGDGASLQKAIESYEKALALKEDNETRENLKAVKKALEQMKQQQEQQQNDQQCDNPKEGEEGNSSKENDSQQDPKDQDQKKQNDQQQNDKGDSQNQQNEQNPEQKDQESAANDEQKSAQNNEGQSTQQEQPKPEDQEQKSQQPEAEREAQKQEEQEQPQAASLSQQKQMSDREAQKWLQLLEQNQVGHLYQLNKNDASKQERDNNEKPW